METSLTLCKKLLWSVGAWKFRSSIIVLVNDYIISKGFSICTCTYLVKISVLWMLLNPTVHLLGFSELVHQVFRAVLNSLCKGPVQVVRPDDTYKLDALLLIRLPALLEKLANLMRVETQALKTPTDMYKAFDRLLRDETLLNAVDVRWYFYCYSYLDFIVLIVYCFLLIDVIAAL